MFRLLLPRRRSRVPICAVRAAGRIRTGGPYIGASRAWEDVFPGPAWATVLREASAFDADSLYFGTQSGSFFALADGDTWV
jgi:hypothetical protein